VLCVDDEAFVVEAISRQLAREFNVVTATSGKAGLEALASGEEFAVVISDMKMPQMDGAEFLSQVRERWPSTVRMLLTGHADMTAAAKAVNQGDIFRLLLKPCSAPDLKKAVEEACAQRAAATAARDF
jgi:DNA-binding NtrC family response regulator